MALSDEQRIAIFAAAIRDHQNGTSRSFPDMLRSPDDVERLLAQMDLPLATLLAAGQQAARRMGEMGVDATPALRRALVEEAYAEAVRDHESDTK